MNRIPLAAALIAVSTLASALVAAPQRVGETIEGIEPVGLTASKGQAVGQRDRVSHWWGNLVEAEYTAVSDASAEFAKATLQVATVNLAEQLGSRWHVSFHEDARTAAPFIGMMGPVAADAETNLLAAEAMRSSYEAARESTFAEALPAGPARDRAAELAKAAQERATKAMEQLRAETRIFTLEAAIGEEVASALKAAVPGGTFAQVGGSQVLATGSKRDIEAAERLAADLDQLAIRQRDDELRRMQSRNTATPAGRLLTNALNIDFQGGPVTEYLDTIAKVAGAESWVIEDPRVGGAYIPSIKLTGVTADSAVKMLDGMIIQSADKAQPVAVPLVVQRFDSETQGTGTPPIYRIGAVFPSAPARAGGATQEVPKRTQVFDVSLTQWRDEPNGEEIVRKAHDALLSAIETGIGLVGPSDSFKVKLHPPSGMLFVTGNIEEIKLVDSIVDQWSSRQ